MSALYEVEDAPYGLRLRIAGLPRPDEITAREEEVRNLVEGREPGFGLLLDLRDVHALPAATAAGLRGQLAVCREHGLERVAVVLRSAVTALQARRMLNDAGIVGKARFLDASAGATWETAAVAWIEDGEKPPGRAGDGRSVTPGDEAPERNGPGSADRPARPSSLGLVGARGFEPPASRSRTVRSTRLSYAPS